jgi:hypothetical protein
LSGLGEKTRSPAEKQRDQEVDQAYKSATEKIPSRNAKVDPWHECVTRRSGQAMMGIRRIVWRRSDYELAEKDPTNLRCGYVRAG